VKEKHHEAVSELKWLRLIDKLLFEGINKTEASEVTCKYWEYKESFVFSTKNTQVAITHRLEKCRNSVCC
jgi:hypothetical protein